MAYSTELMINRLNNSDLLVAEEKRAVIGFSNFSTMNNLGKTELSVLYLHPLFHGKGVGTALLEIGMEELN